MLVVPHDQTLDQISTSNHDLAEYGLSTSAIISLSQINILDFLFGLYSSIFG